MGKTENKSNEEAPKKRGRRKKKDLYFGPEQEEAVVRFLETDDYIERNDIYNKHLRKPIEKMVESIIRKYKLYRKSVSFEEVHTDTISFLITKAEKYDATKGKKAYSYYGTICKNYILGLIDKDKRTLTQFDSYEDNLTSLETDEEFSYTLHSETIILDDFINKIIVESK